MCGRRCDPLDATGGGNAVDKIPSELDDVALPRRRRVGPVLGGARHDVIYLYIYLSLHIYLFVYRYISICLSVCLSVSLSLYLSIYLSVCLSVRLLTH